MSTVIDISGDAILTAVRSFLTSVLPTSVQVVAGLDNQAPMPTGDFIVMTLASMERLSYSMDSYSYTAASGSALASMTPWRVEIALDIYSPNGQQYAALLAGLLRSEYGTDNFPAPVVPLYCSDPKQLPLITAGENWLQRWRMELSAQVNGTVTLATETADQLQIGLEPIDQNFAP